MDNTALKRIFDFLEKKEQQNLPFLWKHKNNMPFTEEDLNVKGDLDLSFTSITSLPEGLEVGDYLNLFECESLHSLPEGLKVGGNLDLRYSKIKSLPKGLEVGHDLYIYGTPIAKFEDNEIIEMVKPGFIKGKIYR